MSDPADAARTVVLNAASSELGAWFGLLEGGTVRREGHAAGRGGVTLLPMLLHRALDELRWPAASVRTVAVVVGPGSFTALRASLALAHGLALGAGAAVVGVTVGEALALALRRLGDGDPIWCASHARRDRVFIEHVQTEGAPPRAAMLDALPPDAGPDADRDAVAVLVAGDAEEAVAAALLRRGSRVRRAGRAAPSMAEVADAAWRRRTGRLPPRPAQPLYVDPPEARLPAALPA